MGSIAEWLATLGLSEYAPRFAENRIDLSVLRDLTDQDLKDLGIVLGDRRKLLRAIADLKDSEKSAPVAQWLKNHGGIKSTEFHTAGFGARQPVAPNQKPDGSDDPEGRQKNRRVSLIIQK